MRRERVSECGIPIVSDHINYHDVYPYRTVADFRYVIDHGTMVREGYFDRLPQRQVDVGEMIVTRYDPRLLLVTATDYWVSEPEECEGIVSTFPVGPILCYTASDFRLAEEVINFGLAYMYDLPEYFVRVKRQQCFLFYRSMESQSPLEAIELEMSVADLISRVLRDRNISHVDSVDSGAEERT